MRKPIKLADGSEVTIDILRGGPGPSAIGIEETVTDLDKNPAKGLEDLEKLGMLLKEGKIDKAELHCYKKVGALDPNDPNNIRRKAAELGVTIVDDLETLMGSLD